MPKRSNPFQRLIRAIYSQMVPQGATVIESEMLEEPSSNSMREADILVEYEDGETKIRMAVECRDKGRVDSIEWIDGLIGKYVDLDIDKVVAVNKMGFSAAAVQKARAHGIEIRSLEEALDTDWPEEFSKLGIAKMTYRTVLKEAWVETDPPIAEWLVAPTEYVTDEDGNVQGTLIDAVEDIFERAAKPKVQEYVNEHLLDMFETLADLKTKLLLTQHPVTPPVKLFLTDHEGESRRIIRNLTLSCVTVFSADMSMVENYSYGEIRVTTGKVHFEGAEEPLTINIIQEPEDEGTVASEEPS